MRIAIIGCGNMGKSLAYRLANTSELFFYDRNPEKAEALAQEGYGKACKDLKGVLESSDTIILAVKPSNLKEAAGNIQSLLKNEQLIISLLAGTPISALRQFFPKSDIVRMMPNLALIYGEGIIGLSADDKVTNTHQESITNAFNPLGKIYWLPENKIDALTALASSGPAFVFSMIEAMVDAGIYMGFTAKDSQELIHQMLHGSLTLLEKTHKHPGELKWQIASPGGTTIAGLKKLEEAGLRGGIINTFLAAQERAHQLSSHWEESTKT